MNRIAWKAAAIIVGILLLLPTAAYAQAAITGVVRDTSGAVLPGVTVEAASPVLIEKARSVVSDDTGQYRIVDLRPGTYSVTFTLPGFSTVRREGIELSGTFVAINLIEPFTVFADRRNNIDFRVAKIVRYGRTRTLVGLDIYNLTNTDVVTGYNETFTPGGQWLRPTAIQPARYARISAQVDF